MGHRDTDMIIKVYAKFVGNADNSLDGNVLSDAHERMFGNCG